MTVYCIPGISKIIKDDSETAYRSIIENIQEEVLPNDFYVFNCGQTGIATTRIPKLREP